MIKKEEIEKITQIRGNVRGAVFQSHASFIMERRGREGLKAVEKKMAGLGYLLNFKKINVGGWYPKFLSILTVVTAKDLFNWTEKDVFEMGKSAPKYSFISKMLMTYFISLGRFLAEVPKYWKKHFDTGELKVAEFNEVKKYIILREKNHSSHPLMCFYHAGYYQRIAGNVIRSEKITIEETKCVFKGDPYHEYIIRWE